jgi:hypothetical protein
VAVGLTIYNSFVVFEDLAIDRYGWWRYLPFYKFGRLCVWDLGAILAIIWFLAARLAQRLTSARTMVSEHSIVAKLAVALMWINAFALGVGILERYSLLSPALAPVLLLCSLGIVSSIIWWVLKRPAPGRHFLEQPPLVKVAAGLALWNFFFFLEYLVINPMGLWKYLPLYNLQGFSAWDFAVPLGIGLLIWSKGFRTALK